MSNKKLMYVGVAMIFVVFVLALFTAGTSAGEEYTFVTMWPELPQPWYFDDPEGIAVDGGGYVYVADTGNNRIQKFDSSGKFITKWGSEGTGDGEFDRPASLAVDGSGNVFVADTGNDRIQKFDSNGNFITKWGCCGTGEGEFDRPHGIAGDSSGNIYITDTGNSRIQKFDSDGNFITKWGSGGRGDGEFHFPEGIAVDSSGNVFVADMSNHRIQKFDSFGHFITSWDNYGTGDGKFDMPWGIAVDGSGNVFVADTDNNRIQKFDSYGNFITKWGGEGTGDGEFDSPASIAMDSRDNVFVADSRNDRIQKFNSDGNFITSWGSCGTGEGEFNDPCGIAVDSSGNIYVADTHNNRIQKFKIHPAGGTGEIATQITAGADDGFAARTPEYFSADSKAITIGTDLKFDAFLRFPDLKIPTKATITKAYITVVPAVTNPAGPMVHISAADAADPTAPATSSEFYARKRTASSDNWDASSWNAGKSENSTDISSVIQELVDSYDYFAGAPILIFLDIAEGGTENQYFAAFENGEYETPKLFIEYSMADSTGGGLDITPPRVTITSPEDGRTYTTTEIALAVTANASISRWSYSLNGADPLPFSHNITIAARVGDNSVVVFAEDMVGNVGSASVSFYLSRKF